VSVQPGQHRPSLGLQPEHTVLMGGILARTKSTEHAGAALLTSTAAMAAPRSIQI
jgi:hypothetical protein